MLGKLLKYELPAMGRKLLPLYAAWAVTALVLGLSLQSSASKNDFIAVMSVLLYVAVATAIAVMTIVMIIQRYSKSLLGDEAYFNQVLPVSVSAHIGNKLISATIWVAVTALAALLTGVLILLGGGIVTGFESYDPSYIEIPKNFWLYAFEFLILMIAGTVKTVMQIYTAVTIGHQVQDHVTLASIGAYIAVMIAESMIGRIIIQILWRSTGETSLEKFMYGSDGFLNFSYIFFPTLIMTLAISAVYFFICKYLMEKRLNLA